MGNQESLTEQIPRLQQKNWIEADQDQHTNFFSNVNPFRKRLLMNISTHELIQQYQINFIAEQDFSNYLKQINYRYEGSAFTMPMLDKYKNINPNEASSITNKSRTINKNSNININNNSNANNAQDNITNLNANNTNSAHQKIINKFIYPIHYFTNKSKQEMCTTVYTGYIYIQKVDLRLKQINDIPFEDQLYIYKATLEGFKILYQKVGYFDIKQEMIFINKKGEVKVWMNANLSKNYPNFQKTYKQQSFTSPYKNNQNNSSRNLLSYNKNETTIYGSQSQMIKDLLHLVESNSDSHQHQHQHQHQQQLQYIQNNKNTYFFSDYLDQKNVLERMSFDYALQEFQNYVAQNHFRVKPYMSSILELFSNNNCNLMEKQNQNNQEMFKKAQIPRHNPDNRYKDDYDYHSEIQQSHVNQVTIGQIESKVNINTHAQVQVQANYQYMRNQKQQINNNNFNNRGLNQHKHKYQHQHYQQSTEPNSIIRPTKMQNFVPFPFQVKNLNKNEYKYKNVPINQQPPSPNININNKMRDSRYSYSNSNNHIYNNEQQTYSVAYGNYISTNSNSYGRAQNFNEKIRESSRSNNLVEGESGSGKSINLNLNMISQNNLSRRFVQGQGQSQAQFHPVNNNNHYHQKQPVFYPLHMPFLNNISTQVRQSKSQNPHYLNTTHHREQTPSFSHFPTAPRSNLVCINNRPVHILKNVPTSTVNSAIGLNQVSLASGCKTKNMKQNLGPFAQNQAQNRSQFSNQNSHLLSNNDNGSTNQNMQSKLAFKKTTTMESQGLISNGSSNMRIESIQKMDNLQNTSKSNIKYYSSSTTYELDDQIAQDLQKMLGLTVK